MVSCMKMTGRTFLKTYRNLQVVKADLLHLLNFLKAIGEDKKKGLERITFQNRLLI